MNKYYITVKHQFGYLIVSTAVIAVIPAMIGATVLLGKVIY